MSEDDFGLFLLLFLVLYAKHWEIAWSMISTVGVPLGLFVCFSKLESHLRNTMNEEKMF